MKLVRQKFEMKWKDMGKLALNGNKTKRDISGF